MRCQSDQGGCQSAEWDRGREGAATRSDRPGGQRIYGCARRCGLRRRDRSRAQVRLTGRSGGAMDRSPWRTSILRLFGYMSHWYGNRHTRPYYVSDQEMLDALRNLWRDQGYLSQKLIKKTTSVSSIYEYCKRFGSLSAAYALIGFTATSHPSHDRVAPTEI